MSHHMNKAIAGRIPNELFNEGRLDLVGELVEPDYVEHAAVPPGWPAGLEGLRKFVTELRTAFPDFHYTVDLELQDGAYVVQRLTATGTHQGMSAVAPVPPTGRRVSWTETHISRFQDEKLVEHWQDLDQLGMLTQLGIVPAPGGASAG